MGRTTSSPRWPAPSATSQTIPVMVQAVRRASCVSTGLTPQTTIVSTTSQSARPTRVPPLVVTQVARCDCRSVTASTTGLDGVPGLRSSRIS